MSPGDHITSLQRTLVIAPPAGQTSLLAPSHVKNLFVCITAECTCSPVDTQSYLGFSMCDTDVVLLDNFFISLIVSCIHLTGTSVWILSGSTNTSIHSQKCQKRRELFMHWPVPSSPLPCPSCKRGWHTLADCSVVLLPASKCCIREV